MGERWYVDVNRSLQSMFDDRACPQVLRQALGGVLSWQTRSETTIRRALASARVAPQWMAALLALGTTVTLETDGGEAEKPLAAARASQARALHVPLTGLQWGAARVARTPADAPIVSAVAALKVDGDVVEEARLALTGTWPETVRLAQAAEGLVGGGLDDERLDAVVAAVQDEVQPTGDFLAGVAYRRAMAGTVTRRALSRLQDGP